MTELELEREVRRLLAERGLYGYHHPDSRRAGAAAAGFPDWVVIGRGVLWRELKSPHAGLSQPQWDMANLLLNARQDWGIWRPNDLLSGRIAAELDAVVA